MRVKQGKGNWEGSGDGCLWEEGRSGEDPGKIHRSVEFGVQGCQRRRERMRTRIKSLGIRSWWGILWVSDRSDEGFEE